MKVEFNWPNSPPKFTKKQMESWQNALQTTFGVSHPIPSDRALKPSCRLKLWTKSDIYDKWTTRYSMDENRIYKKVGMSWQEYSGSGRGGTRSRTYTKTDRPSSSANYLASVCSRNTKFAIECYTSWEDSDVDDDPLLHDTTLGPFISLQNAFQTSVNARNILLDTFKIPDDNCKLIAAAIEQGTAIAVCDGSFDPNDRLGTAAFLMVADKKRPK